MNKFFLNYRKQPLLYTLAMIGSLSLMLFFSSFYVPTQKIKIIKEVEKIEYKNINVFISGMTINTVIQFYKDNLPKEYEKILTFYDKYTKSRSITKVIIEQSLKIGVPVNLAFALAERESRFNPRQENKNSNKSWDRGLFQLNSASRPKWKIDDYFNIEKNTIEGLSYLKWLLDKFQNNDLSIAAYNAGCWSITKKVLPFTTAIHVFEIKNNETKYNIDFNTKLLPTLNNIQYSEGQFKLHI